MTTPQNNETRIAFDVFAHYGRNLILKNHEILKSRVPPTVPQALKAALADGRLPKSKVKTAHPEQDGVTPVGILGAGMAGLYTALILDDLGIPYQILEASATRVGGRCYTYNFPNGGPYDYYDVGAMRFPLPQGGQHGVMTRLAHLFDYMKIPLLEYIFKIGGGILLYNNVYSTVGAVPPSTFDAQGPEGMQVPQEYVDAGPTNIVNDFITPLATLLLNDINTGTTTGWEIIRSQYDQYSTRSYLQFKYIPSASLIAQYNLPATSLSTDVINWLETFDKSTGWYDRALTESVLEAVAFGEVGPPVDWKCIDRGTSVLPNTIQTYIAQKTGGKGIVMNAPVTAIAPANPEDITSPLNVTAGGTTYSFSHVISTLPLPVFRTLDTSTVPMTVMQMNALRQLQYGPSIKVGIQFKSQWWAALGQKGGQSYTDLPIRTIVYPSYGSSQPSNVLIASYCWTNDAERLGSLMTPDFIPTLQDLVLRNLATVHQIPLSELQDQFVALYPWDWNHDPLTGGAFAFFGPGQYEKLYDSLTLPAANGRLQFAGELLSVRHAWIVGALDSAWCAVDKYLSLSGASPETFQKFYKDWGINWEWTASGAEKRKGPLRHSDNLLLEHLLLHNADLFQLE